jgi:hypothetical protein
MSPHPYRVGFSTTTHWLSRLIRWFTGGAVSHAWILYWDEDFNCDCVLEFTEGGCRIKTFAGFKSQNQIVKVWTPQCSIRLGFVKVREWLEAGYDYAGLLGMIWVMIGRWLHRKWRNPWGSAQKAFCSEGVVRVLIWAGYPGAERFDPETTTPADLLDFAQREEFKYQVPT